MAVSAETDAQRPGSAEGRVPHITDLNPGGSRLEKQKNAGFLSSFVPAPSGTQLCPHEDWTLGAWWGFLI